MLRIIELSSFSSLFFKITRHAVRNKSDKKYLINPVILPTEYRGTVLKENVMKEFLILKEKHKENLRK